MLYYWSTVADSHAPFCIDNDIYTYKVAYDSHLPSSNTRTRVYSYTHTYIHTYIQTLLSIAHVSPHNNLSSSKAQRYRKVNTQRNKLLPLLLTYDTLLYNSRTSIQNTRNRYSYKHIYIQTLLFSRSGKRRSR